MADSIYPDPSFELFYRLRPEWKVLRNALLPLAVSHRIAFALCCCQRIYDVYLRFIKQKGLTDGLKPILERTWQHVMGDEMPASTLSGYLAYCQSLSLNHDYQRDTISPALRMIEAVYLMLQACQRHSLDYTVRVAECVRNRIDNCLWKELTSQQKGSIAPSELAEIEAAITSHPLMVAELQIEEAQVKYLQECEFLTERAVEELLDLGRS